MGDQIIAEAEGLKKKVLYEQKEKNIRTNKANK